MVFAIAQKVYLYISNLYNCGDRACKNDKKQQIKMSKWQTNATPLKLNIRLFVLLIRVAIVCFDYIKRKVLFVGL